jgi:hypothetical protein
MRRLLLLLAFAAATLSLVGCEFENFIDGDRYKEDFNYSYDLKPGGTVAVESLNGSVEIAGWEKNSVQITGTKYAATQDLLSALKVDVTSTGDAVRIRVVKPSERRGGMGARFVLRVPYKSMLDRITTSNGSIRVEGIEGDVRLKTSNGSVKVSKTKGPLEAITSNSSIELLEFEGGAVLNTSNGHIKADGIRGRFEATTSNSSVDARLLQIDEGRPIKVESSNGSINLTVESLKGNDIVATTSNSSITLRLPAAINAQLTASTSNSSITSDFDVSVRGTQSKNRLEGTIGSGGPKIEASTSNGSVKILKL